jgi:hypothetical protein
MPLCFAHRPSTEYGTLNSIESWWLVGTDSACHNGGLLAGVSTSILRVLARKLHSRTYMPSARHLLALLRTHVQGDDHEFYSVAMQLAAQEARKGHIKFAEQIKHLVDKAKVERRQPRLHVLEPKGELDNLMRFVNPLNASQAWCFR